MNGLGRLGAYELLQEIGYGGMGSVFLARRDGPGRFHKRVAIKTIHPHLAKEQAFVDMFLDEARIAAAMNHPNVAQVFDLGEVDGRYFLAMEYLHGEHLGVVRERVGRIDPNVVACIASFAARGLHHAHEACDADGRPLGLVHRDVSPQNIFLTYDGQVKVTDFGIARAEGRLSQTTDTGRIKGKCAYMAPEQVTSKPVDRRADIFALGVVMRELLSGQRLFAAASDAETLLKIASDEVPPLDDSFPKPIAEIVTRALAHDANDRYATAEALADALDDFRMAAGPMSNSALSELMSIHFGTEREKKEEAARSDPSILPNDSSTSALADTVLATQHASTSGVRQRLGLLFLVVAAIGLGVWSFRSSRIEHAVVHIDSRPSGAMAVVDGEHIGSTPVVARNIRHGRHELSLRLEGFQELEVRFDADRADVELSYQLRQQAPPAPVPMRVEVESDAETAVEREPEAPRMRVVSRREPRAEHAVSSVEQTEQVERGVARLTLVTQPWATISINGRDFGRTPLYQRSVPAGVLHVELKARGDGPIVTRTIHAERDALISDRIVLAE